MADCKIAPCKCQSAFQDEVYGKGNRVWNPTGKDATGYRCTVCGATTGSASSKKK